MDAAALEAAVGSWRAAWLQAGRQPLRPGQRERRAVAVDGKAVRGARRAGGDGQAVHLLAAAGQRSAAVLAQAKVDGKTNEIIRFAPLLEPLDLAGATAAPSGAPSSSPPLPPGSASRTPPGPFRSSAGGR